MLIFSQLWVALDMSIGTVSQVPPLFFEFLRIKDSIKDSVKDSVKDSICL